MKGNPAKLRRAPRVPLNSRIRLCWANERGENFVAYGRTTDISEVGLSVQTEVPLLPHSYVSFRIAAENLEGSASVRHVKRAGLKYTIGLDFTGGLRWNNDPPPPAPPPVPAD
ncbi:MAG: PilZ domain-containing protein [Bryobacteraceae bacterium]|nr:PilZ domain-containing protein [Bryobacteraceae bacterium]